MKSNLRERVAALVELFKLRMTLHILITTLIGFYMASGAEVDWFRLPPDLRKAVKWPDAPASLAPHPLKALPPMLQLPQQHPSENHGG